ncbi:hypothetical protein [Leptolyngbya sp. 7M]|uniref:hypothetical protein n=1 Tax=Leptolyngbya sp. 7M TaxID=2812896 RepID=UPI001B8CAC95|nr:hypothetical protein [Leptolyngbya sp. 7M]QYO62585.1 hypothetical protein JVX88_21305 [Leptolyngbya sp. 7M]
MTSENAKSQARGTRGSEERVAESENIAPSQEWTGGNSSGISSVRLGAARAGGEKKNFVGASLGGKIIAQLIREAEDQLGTARECIDWYQREEQKALTKLEQLRQLQEEQQAEEL